MKTIKYKMADGRIEDIEVTDEFAAKYAEFEKEEQRREWREDWRARRTDSIQGLAAAGQDIADPVNRDPLELLIEQEAENVELPLFTGLTEYQQCVAYKFYVEHKTHKQIAKEEGVARPVISKLISKIQAKLINAFIDI